MTAPDWDLTGSPVGLSEVKQHLNKPLSDTADDDEIRPMIWAAVERVERHLGYLIHGDAAAALTASQRLAVLEVLADYMGTQGPGALGAPAVYGQQAEPADVGMVPLEVRLTDLLGPAVPLSSDSVPSPRGCFPDAPTWPFTYPSYYP